jgi:diguanylate cyclase (GGDEF)-like protein
VHLTRRDHDIGAVSSAASRWPRGRAVAVIALGLLAVFWLDRATDAAPVQHLYYVPIILSAIRFGQRGGLTAALAAILLYHAANPGVLSVPYEEGDVVQITLFAAMGLVTAKLVTDRRRLAVLAMTDDLTGLHNLRSFEAHLTLMIRDDRAPLSLLVLDVDRLKTLNDGYGHLTGAEAVRTVGHLIADHVTEGAVACRYGGDEFVIALPGCAEPEALATADRIRAAVWTAAPVLAGRPFASGSLSVSVGIACHARAGSGAGIASQGSPELLGEGLFRAADAALYAAKAGGRNRVAISATADLPGRP